MGRATEIINWCASNPFTNGTCSREVVNEILSRGNTVICCGHLREFEFTVITPEIYSYKTVNWYNKHKGEKE